MQSIGSRDRYQVEAAGSKLFRRAGVVDLPTGRERFRTRTVRIADRDKAKRHTTGWAKGLRMGRGRRALRCECARNASASEDRGAQADVS